MFGTILLVHKRQAPKSVPPISRFPSKRRLVSHANPKRQSHVGERKESWHWAPLRDKGGSLRVRVFARAFFPPLSARWVELGRLSIFQGEEERGKKKIEDWSSLFTEWRLWTSTAFPPAVLLARFQGIGLRPHQISFTRQSPRIIGPRDYNLASFSRQCYYTLSRQKNRMNWM